MNTNSKLPEIRKEAFIQAREKLSLTTKDLGGMACLSTRQIEQIENGETSSFYGTQIKVTAAKKVAKLLSLSDEEAFDYGSQASAKIIEAPTPEEFVKTPNKKVKAKKEAAVAKDLVEETQALELATHEEKKESTKIEEPKKVESIKAITQEIPFATSVGSKSASPKKLFLWLGVLAALIFSAINLRPLFFADKPEEILVVKEEVIEAAPTSAPTETVPATPVALAPAASVPAVSADASTACPAEEGIISYKTDAPRKAADMVYVQVKSKQVICVSDAAGKMQNKLVEPGAGASFYGKPPFKVLTNGLAQAEVFFQGAKVRLTNPNYKTLVLEAAEVAVPPVDRTDSQQR